MSEKLSKITVTGAELAEVLALTDRRIRDLAADGTLRATNGNFPLVLSVQRYVKRLRSRTEKPTIAAARRRKLEAEATLSELHLAEKQGHLVSVEAMAERLVPMLTAVRQYILGSGLDQDTQGDILEALGKMLQDAIL